MADWQKGDLALCVKASWRPRAGVIVQTFPRVGGVYSVEAVTRGRTMLGLVLGQCETSNPLGWAARKFVKITPGKADEFDREVIDLMAGKKVPA